MVPTFRRNILPLFSVLKGLEDGGCVFLVKVGIHIRTAWYYNPEYSNANIGII
jgi:hypothetical protein